ncbi:MAG: glutamate decarboxylase, partial [Bifidobacteriaceae bacterium]|jgi:glutamate decarboxylase|nr:glutamate decarboxylase [Bifidobacteriaceae bacterium]
MGPFRLWNDGQDIPVFAWSLDDAEPHHWSLHDLSDRLRMRGWLVPAYPMPDSLQDLTVQRIVVRDGMSLDLADALLADIRTETQYLERLDAPLPPVRRGSFHH